MGGKRKGGTRDEAARRRAEAKLDALYAELPRLKCKGKCWQVCTPIIATPLERERIRREGGVEIPPPAVMKREGCDTCPALEGRSCTVYEIRPAICRLWGIDETMKCPHGCKPEGGWLTREEAVRISLRSYVIGGWPAEVPRLSPKEVSEVVRTGRSGKVVINPRDEHRDETPADEPAGPRRGGLLKRLRRSG